MGRRGRRKTKKRKERKDNGKEREKEEEEGEEDEGGGEGGGEGARIMNVGADWEIVRLTLTFNQADAFAKSFVPQPSFQPEKQMVVLAIVCCCIGGFLDDSGDLK